MPAAGQDWIQFTKGTGVIAVGDSDQYDDKADNREIPYLGKGPGEADSFPLPSTATLGR